MGERNVTEQNGMIQNEKRVNRRNSLTGELSNLGSFHSIQRTFQFVQSRAKKTKNKKKKREKMKIVFVICVKNNDWLRSNGRWEYTSGHQLIRKRNGHSDNEWTSGTKTMLCSTRRRVIYFRMSKLNWSWMQTRKEIRATHVAIVFDHNCGRVIKKKCPALEWTLKQMNEAPWCQFLISSLISWVSSVAVKGSLVCTLSPVLQYKFDLSSCFRSCWDFSFQFLFSFSPSLSSIL